MAHGSVPTGPIPSNAFTSMFPNRRAIEDAIEQLISALDAIDGDPDREEDGEDCCEAYDDRAGEQLRGLDNRFMVGNEDDSEYCHRTCRPALQSQGLPSRLP